MYSLFAGQPIAPTDLLSEKNDTVRPHEFKLLLYGTVPHNGSTQKNLSELKLKSSLDSSDRMLWLEFFFIIFLIISSDFKSAWVTNPASNLFHFSMFLKLLFFWKFFNSLPAAFTESKHIFDYNLIISP